MEKNRNNAIILVFHDSGMSGGTLALLELIEKWYLYSQYTFVCVLPKRNIILEEKLQKLNCKIIVFRYWQAVWNDSGNIIRKSVLIGKLCLGLINTCVNYFRYIRKYDIKAVYSNTSSIYNGILISKLSHAKHIWHIREFVAKEHGVYPLLGEEVHYKLIDRLENKVIFISNSLADEYRKYLKSCQISVVYDDVSKRYIIEEKIDWNKRKNNILVAGNISTGKRQLDVVNAFSGVLERHPDVKLYFAGRATDEEYYLKIKKIISNLGLKDNIMFLGQIDNINEVRKKMGIGIIPSYKEAFGRVTIEGMLAGMVMIGSDDSGTKELIKDKVNGYLFSLEDSENLTKVINEVLESHESTLNRIRQNATAFAKCFTEGKCANKIEELF